MSSYQTCALNKSIERSFFFPDKRTWSFKGKKINKHDEKCPKQAKPFHLNSQQGEQIVHEFILVVHIIRNSRILLVYYLAITFSSNYLNVLSQIFTPLARFKLVEQERKIQPDGSALSERILCIYIE